MIVDDHSKKDVKLVDVDPDPVSAGPSSQVAPPSFEDTTGTRSSVVRALNSNAYAPLGGEELPPAFVPYEAEYFETDDGTIVSHDPHLNEDGEALYRFLLSHSQTPPRLYLHVHGDHEEHRTHSVPRTDSQGRTHWRTETETITVVDFDFYIDISRHVPPNPMQWSVPDERPAYRGKMYMEVDTALMRTGNQFRDVELGNGVWSKRWKATRGERKIGRAWALERHARGLPPWIGPDLGWAPRAQIALESNHMNVCKSTRTVREWADEYCASPKQLKEFTYDKVIHGWNFDALEAAVIAAVKSTYYQGSLTVRFKQDHNKIHIRADNTLSRTLSNTWLVVLLWVTLIYPFIWLYKRYSVHGGGRWQVCGGAYALVSWQPIQEEDDLRAPPPPFSSIEESWPSQSSAGNMRVVGLKEGEWFQRWEATIKRAVSGRLKSQAPFTEPDGAPPAALMLDGYHPSLSP